MRLKQLLDNVNPKYEADVKSICDRWKKKVQESLKDMMRFTMSPEVKIKFSVNAAYTNGLLSIDLTNDELRDFYLFQYKYNLENLFYSVNKFPEYFIHIKDYLHYDENEYSKFLSGKTFVNKIISQIPQNDSFLEKLKSINEDIFGVYQVYYPVNHLIPNHYNIKHNNASIYLYWSIIALFAERYNLDLEAVTVIILSHEYSHAYSHLGIDANKHHWITDNFQNTDKLIKEGIAEYFSKKFMDSCNDTLNRFSHAYNVLLDCSPEIYKEYKSWGNPSLEAIRYTMLQTRHNNITNYNSFLDILDQAKKLYPN